MPILNALCIFPCTCGSNKVHVKYNSFSILLVYFLAANKILNGAAPNIPNFPSVPTLLKKLFYATSR